MYKHILIATDGSELASRGVEQGLSLAGPLGARVTVLTVVEPLDPNTVEVAISAGVRDPVARYEQSVARQMKERFAEVESRAATKKVEVELLQEVDDSPAEAIVRAATARKCDLIVMASHGRRGVRKLILGSQTSEVLALTTISVLVVR